MVHIYLIRRVAQAVFTFGIVATILFLLFRFGPADPTAAFMSPALDPQQQDVMAERFGIDQPLYKQYIQYLTNIITLDFGYSFDTREPVSEILRFRVVNTSLLMGSALLIAFSLGPLIGGIAAWNHGESADSILTLVAVVFRGIPPFLLALLLVFVFGHWLEWFPRAHMINPRQDYAGPLDMYLSFDFIYHLVLPVLALVGYLTAFPLLLTRTAMLETKGEEYINIARAKGLREKEIFLQYGMRNSLIPVVTTLPIVLGAAVVGNILIETIFSWPGIGRTIVNAITNGDFPLAQATFLLIAAIVISGNFVIDLLYTVIDPRITYK